MTEERRIFEGNGIKLNYTNDPLWSYWEFITSKSIPPTPITKEELEDMVFDKSDVNFSYSGVIKLIGIDEFWNKYGKKVNADD